MTSRNLNIKKELVRLLPEWLAGGAALTAEFALGGALGAFAGATLQPVLTELLKEARRVFGPRPTESDVVRIAEVIQGASDAVKAHTVDQAVPVDKFFTAN